MESWSEYVQFVTAMFVIVNPIGAAPAFMGLTSGRTGINIVTRLMGLILAAVAVKFIADGVTHLLQGLSTG